MTRYVAMRGSEHPTLPTTVREKLLLSLNDISTNNTHFEPLWREKYTQSADLWFESMLLALALQTTQPNWLGMVWDLLLKGGKEASEKRTQFLNQCALVCPEWITIEILRQHNKTSQYNEGELRRFLLYQLGLDLEETDKGRQKLATLVGKENASGRDIKLLVPSIMNS